MNGASAAGERALREQAIGEGAALFAHHGEAACELLTASIHDPDLSPAERRRYRLARVEVERLSRERRRSHGPHAMVVWRPPLFSWAGLAGLFGLRRASPSPSPSQRRRRRP